MQTKTATLSLSMPKAWLMTALFVVGNLLLPQLCHLMPQGGLMFLPIYFFTLIAAYLCGWQVGLLTAIASPLLNSALFGMPVAAMLPIICLKGVLLAGAASYAAYRFGRPTLLILLGIVLAYQIVGCGIEAIATSSISAGVQDFTLGLPGLVLQVVLGYAVLRYFYKG